MSYLAVGFWGAFFGSAALVLAGSALLFTRQMKRAATIGAVSATVPVLYALAFLGWLGPDDVDVQDRLLAHVTVASGIVLSVMLLTMLGRLRRHRSQKRTWAVLGMPGVAVLLAGWTLPPYGALVLSCGFSVVLSCSMLYIALQYAFERRRMASSAVGGVVCVVSGLVCLTWIALMRGEVHWMVHAVAAGTGVVYMGIMASALWLRVLYALELRQVMALGPSYDTVTRMHAHSEAGKVVGAFLRNAPGDMRSVGVIAISIANFRALESLHGRAAQNHALYVCASRLRNCAPMGGELCRLGDDGFLMLIRSPEDMHLLRQLARRIRHRLLRPIVLGTDEDAAAKKEPPERMPELGVGIAVSDAKVTPGNAVASARAASRTAWVFPSRIAYSDSSTSEVSELPAEAEEDSSLLSIG